MKKILVTLMFSVFLGGVWFIDATHMQTVSGQKICTVSGKQMSASDGTLICDCTVTSGGGTCSCVIACPKDGEGGFEINQEAH